MTKQKLNAGTIALGGVLLALCIATLFLAGVVPGLELSFYALSSFYIAAMVMEREGAGGLVFYVASVLLAFLILPNKAVLVPYAFFFGLYGLVKYYVEKLRNLPLELILKLLFFNLTFAAGLALFRVMFLESIHLPEAVPVWLLVVAAQAAFLVYDFVFTLVVGFYRRRIHGRIPRG